MRLASISFAVLGYGHIGKQHVAWIQQHPAATLTAMVEPDTRLAAEIKNHLKVPCFNSQEELLATGLSVEVVCVCAPNYLHAPLTILALQNNCHVLCEKPLALTTQQAEAMQRTAAKMGKFIFCVVQNRYSRPARWIKDLVDQNLLGQMYKVQVTGYWNRDARYYQGSSWRGKIATDGGPLFTQFSHFVDTLYWWLGEMEPVQAQFFNFNHTYTTEFEDTGEVWLKSTNGVRCSLHYSTAAYGQNLDSSIIILAEKGSIKMSGQYLEQVTACNPINLQLFLPKPAECDSSNNHQLVLENVIQTLRGNSEPTATAEDGLAVVKIIENIYKLR
ncbi:Gfo/Idh/MocA family protein [Adhaeribacter pallidiroseus]|uniref:Inositol 2-dehydrogenase n=1 Tax=Adhaeribacter pallidiroseus TaxID=2072847 RepID=A0A369QFK5_9BACT|nr:Gfo/Idh/MocA family oxidoreductase [Adhaeribacter pallidiroseus]RDC62006.1 Inositol 2-dehydrogenase [Adhaeribacter pallidiroseus]